MALKEEIPSIFMFAHFFLLFSHKFVSEHSLFSIEGVIPFDGMFFRNLIPVISTYLNELNVNFKLEIFGRKAF